MVSGTMAMPIAQWNGWSLLHWSAFFPLAVFLHYFSLSGPEYPVTVPPRLGLPLQLATEAPAETVNRERGF